MGFVARSILNGKSILAVDDELDVLARLEEEIIAGCPARKFDTATTFKDAIKKLQS